MSDKPWPVHGDRVALTLAGGSLVLAALLHVFSPRVNRGAQALLAATRPRTYRSR